MHRSHLGLMAAALVVVTRGALAAPIPLRLDDRLAAPDQPSPPPLSPTPPQELHAPTATNGPAWKTPEQRWRGSVELGANGSAGNSENFAFRGGLGARRATDRLDTAAKLEYAYATSDGERTKNRGQAEARNDWKLKDSRRTIFALARAEYDEFQDWDWRLSAFVGPGYRFVQDDARLLRGRIGAGLTREIGGARHDLIPEGLAGLDFEWRLTGHSKWFSTAEVYPSFKDASQYRALLRAGLEVLLDEDARLTLKIGAEDRYQSVPGEGKKRNDLDYFALISWNF